MAKKLNNETDLNEAALNKIFQYQNLDSAIYENIDKIMSDYENEGKRLSLCKAYFYGMVNGKRKERRRK